MDEERTLDLTNLYGFARLYKTLVQDGGGKRSTSDMLYGCYLANISLCNKGGMALQPGTNVVSFAADYGDNKLHVVLRYNKQYLGV